jgi:hypothetical protein
MASKSSGQVIICENFTLVKIPNRVEAQRGKGYLYGNLFIQILYLQCLSGKLVLYFEVEQFPSSVSVG